MPPRAARCCTPRPTPRRPRAPPTGSSRSTPAESSRTRKHGRSPVPGYAPAWPSAAPTPHASRLCSPKTRARLAAPSRSYARVATAFRCTAARPPTSARSRSVTASSSTNWLTKSATWGREPVLRSMRGCAPPSPSRSSRAHRRQTGIPGRTTARRDRNRRRPTPCARSRDRPRRALGGRAADAPCRTSQRRSPPRAPHWDPARPRPATHRRTRAKPWTNHRRRPNTRGRRCSRRPRRFTRTRRTRAQSSRRRGHALRRPMRQRPHPARRPPPDPRPSRTPRRPGTRRSTRPSPGGRRGAGNTPSTPRRRSPSGPWSASPRSVQANWPLGLRRGNARGPPTASGPRPATALTKAAWRNVR